MKTCELYLCGATLIDTNIVQETDFLIYGIGASAVGVEETPEDIYTLMSDSLKEDAVEKRIEELMGMVSKTNSETVSKIAKSEIGFHRLLAESQKKI